MGRDDIPKQQTGERRYAEHLYEQLRGMSIDATLVGSGERRSVVASITRPGLTESFMVASHLDTVPVDHMKIDPFDPAVRDGRLYGRGSCDTKAGMAALIDALERVLARGSLRRNLVLVGEADEEFGSAGVADVLDHLGGDRPDWVLSTEPTELRLVTHHKGIAQCKLVASGRACHASIPEEGENAIVALSRAAVAMDELATELAQRRDPLLGCATLSIGQIHGGHSPNVVPDHAWLSVDRRMLPGEDVDYVRAELETLLSDRGISGVAVESATLGKPPLATSADSSAVRACRSALAAMRRPDAPVGVPFATDSGVFALHGIPGVVMGPGAIAQAHTDREFVETRQLEAMADFFVGLLEGATP
jgi:acetylornithine deacetylase